MICFLGRRRLPTIVRGQLLPAVAVVLFASSTTAHAQTEGEWRGLGNGKSFQRYSPLSQIDAQNINKLAVVWKRKPVASEYLNNLPDITPSNYLRGTPIMIDSTLYVSDGIGMVEAVDAATGATKWVQGPLPRTLKEAAGSGTRGVEYWKAGSDERIISIRGQFLYSLDAKTGRPDPGFGDGGKVFLRWPSDLDVKFMGTAGPIVVNDVIVVGGTGGALGGAGTGDTGIFKEAHPENIRGFDVRTGHLLWTFHVMPLVTDAAAKTWGKDSIYTMGSMGAWAPMSADEKLGYVYVPTSAPTLAFYGGPRPGDNLYSNSLLALDAKTGKLMWHFQMVHHDLWDYDTASPPVLGDITVAGKTIHAVMQANKTAFLYTFDRQTGIPVWPIEERPVPPSSVPGEYASPTQPFPTKPAAFDRQGISLDDLANFTPAIHREALELVSQWNIGPLFTPPTLVTPTKRGTIDVPGVWGAASWNTGAFDPDTHMYYAVSRMEVGGYGLTKTTDPEATIDYTVMDDHPEPFEGMKLPPGPGLPQTLLLPSGVPVIKPPYGRITAIDMNKGKIAWTKAHGAEVYRDLPALKGLKLGSLGSPGRAAPLVTKTLLFVGDASYSVYRAGTVGKAAFHAYDKLTGKEVWSYDLPTGLTAAPMTYEVNGKQYVVITIGGPGEDTGWLAFALQ